MRVWRARGVAYEAHYYPAERHSAEEVAVLIGRPPEQVFKTLVVMPLEAKARPLLAVVPGNRELDLKLLAKAAGQKKLRMATQREAESLTGLLVGGISALALLNKGFKVYLDASAEGFERIIVSGGQRGSISSCSPPTWWPSPAPRSVSWRRHECSAGQVHGHVQARGG